MKPLLTFLLTLFFICPLFSQNKLWVGANTAINYDYFRINDPSGYLLKKPVFAGLIGVNLEKGLSGSFSIGTGINFKTYRAKAKTNSSSIYGRAFNSLQFPVYFKYGKYLNNRFFKLNVIAGGSYVVNIDYGEGYYSSGGNALFGFSSIVFNEFNINGNIKQSFILLHGGGGISFNIFKNCKLELNIVRHIGFSEVIRVDVGYSVNGSVAEDVKMVSKGSYTATSLQFFYPLTQWKNEDSN